MFSPRVLVLHLTALFMASCLKCLPMTREQARLPLPALTPSHIRVKHFAGGRVSVNFAEISRSD